jgi:hypothetical protein
MKHKHYDIIVAWAAGIICQYQDQTGWNDLPGPNPHATFPAFFDGVKYRIKPDTKKYRVYCWKGSSGNVWNGVVDNDDEADAKEKSDIFIRWLSDWVEYEV